MPVTKTIGILCILASSFLAGFWMENRLKKRWYLLRDTYEMLSFLQKEMAFHCSMLPEALTDAAAHCTSEAADVLRRTAAGLEAGEGRAFEEIWKSAVREKLPPYLLSEEEYQLFTELSSALCAEDPVMQKTLLEKYAGRFLAWSNKEETDYREKGRLYRSLTAAGGVFLIIVLV